MVEVAMTVACTFAPFPAKTDVSSRVAVSPVFAKRVHVSPALKRKMVAIREESSGFKVIFSPAASFVVLPDASYKKKWCAVLRIKTLGLVLV